MNKEVQSLLQHAELLGVQVEDLKNIVNAILTEKNQKVNASIAAQIDFLLTESGNDSDTIRFILKDVVKS